MCGGCVRCKVMIDEGRRWWWRGCVKGWVRRGAGAWVCVGCGGRGVCVASHLEEQGWVELDNLGEQIEEDLQLRLGRRGVAQQVAEHEG